MPPDVTVLIPSYNSKDLLVPCLEHLSRQTFPADRFETIVTLDGSTDGSRQALDRIRVPYRLRVVEQARKGRAAALNNGAREAEGRLLIVIDSDIVACSGFIQSHVTAHETADVAIGPIPLSPLSPENFMTDGVRDWADHHARRMRDARGALSSTDIYGANLSLPLELFKQLGGYREDLLRTEDYHFGEKILQAGLKVCFCPEAIGEQIYDKTFPAWLRDFYLGGKSQWDLVREFPHLKSKLKIGRYYPLTAAKRLLRPLVAENRPAGKLFMALGQTVLETARQGGLRWRWLSKVQGLMGDLSYWKGVYDAVGDPARFREFLKTGSVECAGD
ncbi:MAG: glycosyltransferase [Nitrospinae bacterium]|nr:glycosyltransferase [Nitrospinota bacterium]